MSSFDNLLGRLSIISEAKVSPYAAAHPAFGPVTSKMRAGGLSSAPLDTIKFIRDTLYYMDILNDQEFDAIKKAPGFTGKKQAMLATLKAKQDVINQRKDEITSRIEDTLDDFIGGIGVNRSREEKYAAQAAAQEIAKEMRKAKSGKQLDDALVDTINMDTILIKASIAKILGEIQANLGEPGFDIDPEALEEVVGYAENIDTLAKLKSFIKQISAEPGYEIIAAYLSSAVKPIEKGSEDEEMTEDEEGDDIESLEMYDVNEDEYDEVMTPPEQEEEGYRVIGVTTSGEKFKSGILPNKKAADDKHWKMTQATDKRGKKIYKSIEVVKEAVTGNEDSMMLGEAKPSYTCQYLTEQVSKDRYSNNKQQDTVSFKERMKPKTIWQLEEMRRYGM